MRDRGIYHVGEGPAAEVHLVVVALIDADKQTTEDVPIYRIQTVSALTGTFDKADPTIGWPSAPRKDERRTSSLLRPR
jgi:hypothetical protein